MNSIWSWILANPVAVIGWIVTVAVAFAGWLVSGLQTRKQNNAKLKNKQKELEVANKQIEALNGQLEEQRKSAESLRKQAEQLKDLKHLYAETNPINADPWSSAFNTSGSMYRVTNSGTRTVTVESVHADDENLPFIFDHTVPFECGPRDAVDAMIPGTSAGTAAFVIEWHFLGDDTKRTTRRPV